MSDKPTTPSPDESDSKAGNGSSMKSLVVICLIAAIAGGGAGAMVLGPKFGAQPAAAASDEGGEDEGHGTEAKGGHGEILSVGNLIINPAGSQGTRFLMVTVGIEVMPKEAMTSLREQELAVRDAIGSLLESKSLTELTQLGARDTIRAALAEKLKPIAGATAKIRVHLPQYVIQ